MPQKWHGSSPTALDARHESRMTVANHSQRLSVRAGFPVEMRCQKTAMTLMTAGQSGPSQAEARWVLSASFWFLGSEASSLYCFIKRRKAFKARVPVM